MKRRRGFGLTPKDINLSPRPQASTRVPVFSLSYLWNL
jgi:hypothetical protein